MISYKKKTPVLDFIKHNPISLLLLAGTLLALLLANLSEPVTWETMRVPVLVFSFMLALSIDLGLFPYSHHNGMVHVVNLSALLALGLTPALWVAMLGTLLGDFMRRAFALRLTVAHTPPASWTTVIRALGKNGLSLGLAGLLYQSLGVGLIEANWNARALLALVPLLGSYFLINKALEAWLVHAHGGSIPDHFRRWLWSILAWELAPLPFSAFLAAVYVRMGPIALIIFGSALVGFWKLAHRISSMRRDLEKRLRELDTINKVGQAIATSLELDILLNTLYRQVSHLMEADYFYIALYDQVRDELTFPLVFENGERKRYSGRRARNGLTEYVIGQRRPVLIPEHTEHIIHQLGLEVIGQPALSWLGVPLAAGDRVLGVITVQSFTRPYAYDEQDMALLSTLAAQAAIALENAQLYGQMRRRTAELALLNTVSTAVSSTLDLNQVQQIVVTSIMPIMVCQKAALFLIESSIGALELVASQGLKETFKQSPIWQGRSLHERVHDLTTVVVPDILTSGRTTAEIELAREEGYRALAEVALVAQNELIGVLVIFYDQVHRFDLAERDLLNTFANQAATAIANARLYSRTDQALARRVDQLSAIERIGRELVSMLEPQRVLNLVLEQAMNATAATQGCIAMLNAELDMVSVVAHRGYQGEAAARFLSVPHPMQEGIVGRVVRSKKLALVPDVAQEPAYVALEPSVKAQLAVPILREGAILGAISLETTEPKGFDKQDANFVSQLATQTAVALRNAELFQERSRRVEELSLLYQASLSLASSLDYTDVLDTISRLARHITNSDSVTLYLYDNVNDRFDRASTQGYEAANPDPSQIRPYGITRRIVANKHPVLIPDVSSYAEANPVIIERGVRSLIGVPVMSRGEVLGVLYVNHRQPHVYTENDVRLVSALANQAGATIANVRLFVQVSEARDRLEAIIDSTNEGILVLDTRGRVVIANTHIEHFSELRREQLLGQTIDGLFQNSPEAVSNLLGLNQDKARDWIARVQRVSTGSQRRVFQVPGLGANPPRSGALPGMGAEATRQLGRMIEPGLSQARGVSSSAQVQPDGSGAGVTPVQSGRARFTELFTTPVLDEVGEAIGWLMVFRDITEAQELEQMRQDLSSMMVHDLRSPLTAVLSGLEMIKELSTAEDNDPLALQAMDVATRGCENMLTMVNTLLDISRLESGGMPLERGPAPFAPLARSAISYLSPLAADRGITVRTELRRNLPLVEIDNDKIRRVLINFLDNALKFAPEDSEVIIRATHKKNATEDILLCSIADSGPGIPKEYHEKIFDRFSQVRTQPASSAKRGSGLGLAFCKLAIEAHGGQVWVESEPGHGSTFFFTLPVANVGDLLN